MGHLCCVLLLVPLLSLLLLWPEGGLGDDARMLFDTHIKLLANADEVYGRPTEVLITMAKMPEAEIRFRVFTLKYLLGYWQVRGENKGMKPYFKYSTSLNTRLKKSKINPSTPLTYESGYFVRLKAKFFEFDNVTLTLICYVPSNPKVKFVNQSVYINLHPPSENCIPTLTISHCSNPQVPTIVNIFKSRILSAHIWNYCDMLNLNLTWSVGEVMGEKVYMKHSSVGNKMVLKRFVMNFSSRYKLWRHHYVITVEGTYNGQIFGSRCYLFVPPEKVFADIAGPNKRNAYINRAIIMDGSLCRDYSKSRNAVQFKSYNWSCTSFADSLNPVCKPDITKKKQFTLRAGLLKLHYSYNFKLSVSSDNDPSISSWEWQHITIVSYDLLHVVIACDMNCERGYYNPKTKVFLYGICYNCENSKIKYSWYLGNQQIFTSKNFSVLITTYQMSTEIKLEITSDDGRRGSDVTLLKQYLAPISGECKLSYSKEVTEAITPIVGCCQGFTTTYPPVTTYYYSKDVLIRICETCNCVFYIPANIKSLTAFICDKFNLCSQKSMSVSVTEMEDFEMTPQGIGELLYTPPIDVMSAGKKGHLMGYYQMIQTVATRLTTNEIASQLLDANEEIQPQWIYTLSRLANLTLTFAERLTPIDDEEQNTLMRAVRKINECFAEIYKDEMDGLLVQQPFINVTLSCVNVYKMMDGLNKHLMLPPQGIYDKCKRLLEEEKLDEKAFSKLKRNVEKFSDNEAKERSLLWMDSMWETERLYRYLFPARQHGLQPSQSSGVVPSVSLEVKCIQARRNKIFTIFTKDRLHTVNFSKDLFDELYPESSTTICIKVISVIRELNWWYPEYRQPSKVLLSVHIYVGEDNFKKEIILKRSVLEFSTIIGKYTPAQQSNTLNVKNKIREKRNARERRNDVIDAERKQMWRDPNNIEDINFGVLNTMQEVKIYRVIVDESALMSVYFRHTTHDLSVLLIPGELPNNLQETISKKSCTVYSNPGNATVLFRNNCPTFIRVSLTIRVNTKTGYNASGYTPVPNGPALFSFLIQLRSCDSWMFEEKRWNFEGCRPTLEYPISSKVHCMCFRVGTYTSYVFNTPGVQLPSYYARRTHTNWFLLIATIIGLILLIICLIVLFIYYNRCTSKTVICDMTNSQDEGDNSEEVHDLLVFLVTGGRINSQTTATVRLIFETVNRSEMQFTLMQDPDRPELARNSTYVIRIRTRSIRLPTTIAVAHNNGGRYPSWYLSRIEVVDVQMQLTQIFLVNRWVHTKFLVLCSSMVLRCGEDFMLKHWRSRFAAEFERLWINWGFLQPLFGIWRDGAVFDCLTRAQRVCICLTKLVITYTVCMCYMGPTTPDTEYSNRDAFPNYRYLFKMFIICVFLTNVVHFLLERIIYWSQKVQ